MYYTHNSGTDQGFTEEKRSVGRGKSHPKKSHCDIHATLRQRLKAVHSLRHEHSVTTLCRVLDINRSTYYKFRNRKDSRRAVENRYIRTKILALYIKSDKRLGAQKMTKCLEQEYRIRISRGRVYSLMKGMNLPKMSTYKTPKPRPHSDGHEHREDSP